jgi:hypothetical protein
LKIWSEHFKKDVIAPNKSMRNLVEIRKDDRGYEVGNILTLKEYRQDEHRFTGREATFTVSHCLRTLPFVPEGYVAMSIDLKDLKL